MFVSFKFLIVDFIWTSQKSNSQNIHENKQLNKVTSIVLFIHFTMNICLQNLDMLSKTRWMFWFLSLYGNTLN